MAWTAGLVICTGLTTALHAGVLAKGAPPPKPEPVTISELPLPPTAPADTPGTCTRAVNPGGTGCISASEFGLQEGPGAMWDNRHVLMTVNFVGAPSAPHPASTYSGEHVIAIRIDGTTFPNGDPWKCLTCGVPEQNRKGTLITANPMGESDAPGKKKLLAPRMPLDHPQAFPDGRRVLAGPNVIDCSPHKLTSTACTPDKVRIFPVRWSRTSDGSGLGSVFREQRLNPDGVHMNWSAFAPSLGGVEQFGYLGKLVFNPNPSAGEPDVPRYDIENDYLLLNNTDPAFGQFSLDPRDSHKLVRNQPRGQIGEMRGWTRDGRNVIGMGFPEAGNADLFITNLTDGASRRLTRDPAYTDPMMMSPDDKWFVAMDTRTTTRHLYYSAMQGVPPLTDTLTLPIAVCCYNDGNRRFFQPILIEAKGDRARYRGQQLNAGPGTPGSFSDPNWNGRADPAWSPDGTRVIYWQALVTAPACGDGRKQTCPTSTAPGGRRTRLMMAHLTSRKPMPTRKVTPKPITVDWAIALRPGDPLPERPLGLPAGTFVLNGKVAGTANVRVDYHPAGGIKTVDVRYTGYTDDGQHIIDGTDSATRATPGFLNPVVWQVDLRASGVQTGTKKTSPGGFVFSFRGPEKGELVTTIDGREYRSPPVGR